MIQRRSLWGVVLACACFVFGGCDSDESADTDTASTRSTADASGDTTGDPDATATGTTTSTDPGDATDPGDTGTTTTTTTTADATSDTATDVEGDLTVPPGGVPIFVAVGAVGRTVVSCDDGVSWVGDRALDTDGDPQVCGSTEPVVCYGDTACSFLDRDGVCETQDTNCDCDHHPGSAQGVAWGNDRFVATFGWGPPGSVRWSADGITWNQVVEGTTYGGLAFGNDTFVAGDRSPIVSGDGETWTDGGAADLQSPAGDAVWNVRVVGFADVAGGRFVITGESGENRDILLSSDAGATWWRPDTLPAECSTGTRAIAGGGEALLIVHRDGMICRSTDGGTTFAVENVGAAVDSDVIWDGTRFLAWGGGQMHESTDGATWTSTDVAGGVRPGSVAYNPPSGTFVTVNGGWQQWYENQVFYHSTNGIDWTEAATYTGSHRIQGIAFGYGAASALCPGE